MVRPLFAVVDLETTGLSPSSDRIIEMAIVLMRGRRVERRYSTLVNPRTSVPSFILHMTGIDPQELDRAPGFEEVAGTLHSLVGDADYFVAHNARFDWGFVQAELARLEWPLKKPVLCTVKLGRRIYPEIGRYALDHLIEHFGITVRNRHRALDDALAAAHLLKLYQERREAWEHALAPLSTAV